MAWTLTRHLMAPYQVVDQGMAWDAYNEYLLVNCEQNVATDPFFLLLNPDDLTDIGWFDSSAVGHIWSVYEFFFSLYDNSLYITATKGGGGQFLVRYDVGGAWQFELSAYYTNVRENPVDNALWASVMSGGLYSNNIRRFSRVNGSTITTHNVGRSAQFPIFDAAGNYYFTSGSVGETKRLYRVDLSTGSVTTLLTHASDLTEMVYNPASNALWICTNNPTWIEYSIGGAALTGRSITMPGGIAVVFGTAALSPNDNDSLFGTRFAGGAHNPRILAASLADGSAVANFSAADGLQSPGHGVFASPHQDRSGDPTLVYGERLCFYALDTNADTGYHDIMEVCPPVPDCPTLTFHDVVGYAVDNQGICYDATNDRLIVYCNQFLSGSFDNTRPLFASIDPDDFTDVTSFNSASPSKQYNPYEFFVSAYDGSIYFTCTEFGVVSFIRYRTVRYSLAGVFQWETARSNLAYVQYQENPQDTSQLWAAQTDVGSATQVIARISRANGSLTTSWNTGHYVRRIRFDASGHIYFCEYSGPGLFKLNVATGSVTSVYTHSDDLVDLFYNAATNRMWLSDFTLIWYEFDCATDTLTGTVRTTPRPFSEGTAVLNPHNNDTLFGEYYSARSALVGISLADSSVEASYNVADGLNDIWPGTFTNSSRACFFALNDNPVLMEDGHPRYDVVEVCICADTVPAEMPDAEYNWPNPPGPRGIHAALRFMSYGLFPPIPLAVPPATLAPRPSGVSHSVINWQELVASTHPDSKEIAYEFAPDRDRHSSHDFDDTGVYSGIYRPEEP